MREITDINLATFIKVVKKIPMASYHFNQQQLWLLKTVAFSLSPQSTGRP
jgi:hypothetical protein